MERIFYPHDLKNRKAAEIFAKGAVYALGFFDGVHIAHRALIAEAKRKAAEFSLPFGIFTFSSEPGGIKPGVSRIYSTEQRLSVLEDLGADFAIVCDFASIKDMAPEEFVSLLCDRLMLKFAVCGFNFRYGAGASADAKELKRSLAQRGHGCAVMNEVSHLGETVCSSSVRQLLESRRPMDAAKLLGLPYFISAEVVHGRGEGKSFGFPTVNTSFPEGVLVPSVGVYLTAAQIRGKIYTAITNVGSCPTFGCRECHAETYIMDFDGNLYGEIIKIYFVEFLRDEKIFDGPEGLKAQLAADKKKAISIATEELWLEIGLK